jgi:hypothetical protein
VRDLDDGVRVDDVSFVPRVRHRVGARAVSSVLELPGPDYAAGGERGWVDVPWYLKLWGFIKKIPWWLWVVLAAIGSLGLYVHERRSHARTKQKLAVAEDQAATAEKVATAETQAREVEAEAHDANRKAHEEIDKREEVVESEADAVRDRIDEHAGDVDAVADDINRELGLE